MTAKIMPLRSTGTLVKDAELQSCIKHNVRLARYRKMRITATVVCVLYYILGIVILIYAETKYQTMMPYLVISFSISVLASMVVAINYTRKYRMELCKMQDALGIKEEE